VARRLVWPDCRNARDLGGLPAGGGMTRTGFMVRSDTLVQLTRAGLDAVSAYGVTTVIDLRSPAEALDSPSPFDGRAGAGLPAYAHLPLIDDETMDRLAGAPGMFERYLMMLDRHQSAFRAIFSAVAESPGAVVIHCFAGKDRTGLVAALALAVAGVPDDVIAADFALSDEQLGERYREWIAAAAPDRRAQLRHDLRCPPERILGVLDRLRQRWGGVEAYLHAGGVERATLDLIRDRLA
jgi:protein-tyrosine phosphatase